MIAPRNGIPNYQRLSHAGGGLDGDPESGVDADAVTYVEAAVRCGLARMTSRRAFLNAHNDSAPRGSRQIPRRATPRGPPDARERFKAQNPRSGGIPFRHSDGGSRLTAQQPDVNIVRVMLQALAAVLGETQSLHTHARDAGVAGSRGFRARRPADPSKCIAAESGVTNTVDPRLAPHVLENYFPDRGGRAGLSAQNRCHGGMLRAVANGYVQREIQQAAYEYQKSIEGGDSVVVGVNRSPGAAAPLAILRIDPANWNAPRWSDCGNLRAAGTPRASAPLRAAWKRPR